MSNTEKNTFKEVSKTSLREDLQVEDYIEDRLVSKIKLYYKFSRRCERAYRVIAFFTLSLGALIPVFMN